MLNKPSQTFDISPRTNNSPDTGRYRSPSCMPSMPVAMRISSNSWQDLPVLGDFDYMLTSDTGISMDRSRAFFSHVFENPDTGREAVHIDVWDSATLTLINKFIFEDIAGEIHINNPSKQVCSLFRSACFVGRDHIALGIGTGFLRILRISDGITLLEARLGGIVECVTCSGDLIAVSVFPGPDGSFEEACGIKLYEVEALVKRKELKPAGFIPSQTFSVLPNQIQFTERDSALLCRSNRIEQKGYTNIIEVYDLVSGTVSGFLKERHLKQTNGFSNQADDGSFVVISSCRVQVYTQDYQLKWEAEIPQELRAGFGPRCFLDPYRPRLFLMRKGVVYELKPGEKPSKCMQNLGYVAYLHPVDKGRILIFAAMADTYDLVKLDSHSFKPLETIPIHPGIETVISKGYDVSSDGTLFIGDREGFIRIVKRDPATVKRVPTGWGTVKKIAANPFKNHVALLTCAGTVMMMSPEEPRPRLHMSLSKKKPVTAGSGHKNILFPAYEKGPLLMFSSGREMPVMLNGVRYASVNKQSNTCEIREYHHRGDFLIDEIPLPGQARGIAELRGIVFLILDNGEIVAFDPFVHHDLIHVASDFQAPLGLCKVSEDRLTVWTAQSVTLLTLSDDFRVFERKHRAVKGIRNIKWDRAQDRLFVSFGRYLSFWSAGLEEMYRLYILPGGKYLIHVPYPPGVRIGVNGHHPGYFWSNTDCFHFFQVMDRQGKIVENERVRKAFLENHFNEFMVKSALRDYKGFYRTLSLNRKCLYRENELPGLLEMPISGA